MTKTLTKTTLAALALGMAVPAMAQSNTGNFDVTLTVTAPSDPTLALLGLDAIPLGEVAQADLTSMPLTFANDYFCIVGENLPSGLPEVSGVPTVYITLSQSGVFNADIGDGFALVGPSRSGTASGYAQLPLELKVASYARSSVEPGLTRGQKVPVSAVGLGGQASCNNSSTQNGPSATKPVIYARRLASADNTNPGGAYSATITAVLSVN